MFTLKFRLSQKLLFQKIVRLYETSVEFSFVRVKPLALLDTKVEKGEAYDTSFEKL